MDPSKEPQTEPSELPQDTTIAHAPSAETPSKVMGVWSLLVRVKLLQL